MTSFSVYQAVPQAEVTDKVYTAMSQENGTQASETAFCGEAVCNFSGRKFIQPRSFGVEVTRVC